MGVGASVPASGGSSSPPSPLVTPQPSPRTEEVDTTPLIPSPTPSLRPWPTRESTSASSPQVEQSTPLRHPSPTNPSPFMEDDNAGGDFYVSPNRSYKAPPTTGQPAGGAKEPDALTILSSKLDRSQTFEVKLKKSKRKVVLSDSEDEEGVRKDDLDIEALQVLANVSLASAQTVEAAFSLSQAAPLRGVGISAGGGVVSTVVPATTVSKEIHVASTFVPSASPIPAVATSTIPVGTSTNLTAAQSSKGKEQIVEYPTPDMERIFKNMEDERIGVDMAKKVQVEEDAQWARQQAESQSKRQQEVNDAAMFYTEYDWLNILAQVATNSSLSQVLLGDDVTEETFPERMAALIKQK
ncbi:hypothetical protein Tco_1050467 [Tanacetum coccineum]